MLFEKSSDTKTIEHVLGECEVGQTITYDELSAAIGRDVRVFALASLRSARQGILREKRIVFGVEKNVGFTRLDDSGIVKTMPLDRKRIMRGAKRAMMKLACVEFAKLTDEEKKDHVVASAQIGTIAMFASKTSTNRIEKQVNGESKQLAIGETLKLFS